LIKNGHCISGLRVVRIDRRTAESNPNKAVGGMFVPVFIGFLRPSAAAQTRDKLSYRPRLYTMK
jgi:hypothetical protein